MMILWFQKVNITLQMQGLVLVISCSSYTVVCTTLLQSGVVLVCGLLFIKHQSDIYQYSPANEEELFNLCHASAHNVIEHIFGVLKHRF